MRELREDLSQVVHPPKPTVGGGFTFEPAAAERSRIRAVAFTLTTSSATANRVVSLSLLDGSHQVIADIPSPATQTNGQADKYVFGLGLYPYSVNAAAAVVAPLPDLWLPAGGSLTVTIANVDTADAITAIRVVLDQVYLGVDDGD